MAVSSPTTLRRPVAVRPLGLLLALALLVLVALASIAFGARSIDLTTVWDALWHGGDSDAAVIVRELRVPRTLLGLGCGVALGLAGALMQALTRNPLADPGILGVNAGASAAVVVAVAWLGVTTLTGYVWFAFVGAATASVVVYALGAAGRSGATPVRLALAGTAITAALVAFTQAITLTDIETFDAWRAWSVGSLAGRDSETLGMVAPFLIAGVLLSAVAARPLNALALGDDAGRALGAHIGRTRIVGALAITLLCGAATAAIGPIVFVGLTVPHIARAITGPDQRWVFAYSAVLAPVLLLGADVIGRLVARPGELQVGIVTAFIGAPVFIALVRRKRIAQL
jgi:iron complex transport system permease protein